MTTEVQRLSRLLFEAREVADMLGDIVEARSGQTDTWSRRVRDEIDAYRAERGWSPHGFGGETDPPTVLGVPVVTDPSMPPGEFEVRSGDNAVRGRIPDLEKED
jgi:hypothetical protein